jgi:hypothetical protein
MPFWRRELHRLAKDHPEITDDELDACAADIVQQLEEGVLIALTEEEFIDACGVGEIRHREAIAQGKRDNHGLREEDRVDYHRVGAAGECAAAKALGVPWTRTINTFKLPDLSTNIQVRTRPYKSGWAQDLQVRPGDKDAEIFVHVVQQVSLVQFRIHGWLYGQEAKRPSAWTRPDRPNPVHYTRSGDLDTIQHLRRMLGSA